MSKHFSVGCGLKGELVCPFAARESWRKGGSSLHPMIHILSPAQNATACSSNLTVGWLLGTSGAHQGEDFRLTEGEAVVGSGWDADLILTTPEVSRKHAKLTITPEGVTIEDNGSATGVAINQEKIAHPTPLRHGDTLRLGVGEFLYVSVEKSTSEISVALLKPYLRHPQAAVAWLLCRSGDFQGLDFRIRSGLNRVGTLPGLEITLPDPNLNSVHFTLDASDQRLFIRNASAGCSVFRGGKLIQWPNDLRDQDVLRIGACEIAFRSLL